MHKIVEFTNEADWLAWRSKGIGASDVPSVMGEGFHTPFELWLLKKGLAEKSQTAAMSLGKQHEMAAISEVEKKVFGKLGVFRQQVAMESLGYPFLRCTLDGISELGDAICEVKSIKGASKKRHKLAPKKYYAQTQMQLFISGALQCIYAEYDIETKEIWLDFVKPNKAFVKKMLQACESFWGYLESNTPPPKTEKETLEESSFAMPKAVQWGDLEEKYAKAKEMVKWAKSNLDLVEEEMEKIAGCAPAVGQKYELKYAYSEGALDLECIRELRGINLSQYRKPPSKRVLITERK
jgi:putative phage-type endonuclease